MTSARHSTRIVCISDTHSKYDFDLPDGDILVHAGDFSKRGSTRELTDFLDKLKQLKKFRLKIFIAGNHDVLLQRDYYEQHWNRFHDPKEDSDAIINQFKDESLKNDYGIIYLEDQEFIDPISQLKFYGSPWQPEFCQWAFNLPRDSDEIRAVWDQIPTDTDILITHGPPYGILDSTMRKQHVGCKALYERIQIIRPKLHVFGHIHESYGKKVDSSTTFVNASTCNFRYDPIQKPIIIDI